MARRQRDEDRTENEVSLLRLYSEAEMHSYLGDGARQGSWCEEKARALIGLGNELHAEQTARRARAAELKAKGSKEAPPELSPAMYIAATQAYQAAGAFECAAALNRIAQALGKRLAALAVLWALCGACSRPGPSCVDSGVRPDMAQPADLAELRDLAKPADLAELRDLAKPADLGRCKRCNWTTGGKWCVPSACARRSDGKLCCVD